MKDGALESFVRREDIVGRDENGHHLGGLGTDVGSARARGLSNDADSPRGGEVELGAIKISIVNTTTMPPAPKSFLRFCFRGRGVRL